MKPAASMARLSISLVGAMTWAVTRASRSASASTPSTSRSPGTTRWLPGGDDFGAVVLGDIRY